MKYFALLAFPIVLLAGVALFVARLEAQRVPDWQTALDSYLVQDRTSNELIGVDAAVRATAPANFTAAMGSPVRQHWPWGVDEIPYPPTALWCVLVTRQDRSARVGHTTSQRQVLYAGRHSDKMWRVGWLIHEGPQAPFAPELSDQLAELGCNVAIE